MHAGIERVGGDGQLLARRRLQQGGVVADAQRHVATRAGAAGDVVDQCEFGEAVIGDG